MPKPWEILLKTLLTDQEEPIQTAKVTSNGMQQKQLVTYAGSRGWAQETSAQTAEQR